LRVGGWIWRGARRFLALPALPTQRPAAGRKGSFVRHCKPLTCLAPPNLQTTSWNWIFGWAATQAFSAGNRRSACHRGVEAFARKPAAAGTVRAFAIRVVGAMGQAAVWRAHGGRFFVSMHQRMFDVVQSLHYGSSASAIIAAGNELSCRGPRLSFGEQTRYERLGRCFLSSIGDR
jgi:hypothetical protein